MFLTGVHTHCAFLNLPLWRESPLFVFLISPKQQVQPTLTAAPFFFTQAARKLAFIFLSFGRQVVCEERVKKMESPQRLSREPGLHSEALIPGRGGSGISLALVSVDQEGTEEE